MVVIFPPSVSVKVRRNSRAPATPFSVALDRAPTVRRAAQARQCRALRGHDATVVGSITLVTAGETKQKR